MRDTHLLLLEEATLVTVGDVDVVKGLKKLSFESSHHGDEQFAARSLQERERERERHRERERERERERQRTDK